MAWVRETQRLLPQSLQTRVVHARKQKQTKDKNGCEAVRKEEERQIDNSGGTCWDFSFFFWCVCDQTSISASAATNFGTLMRLAESGWTRTMKYDDAG